MNKIGVIIFLALVISSCSNGKLENRLECQNYPTSHGWYAGEDAKGVYLVNNSKTKKITFTIKKTEHYRSEFSQSEDNPTFETEVYTLNPGEEKFLGCTKIIFDRGIKAFIRKEFEIVGELTSSQ